MFIVSTITPDRVAMTRENHLVNAFFQARKKLGNFIVDPQIWKCQVIVREQFGYISLPKIYVVSWWGKDVLSREIIQAHLSLHWGLHLQERICSPGEQILSFKSKPSISK